MKPVFQDKFYEPGIPNEEQRGNCLSAVIASLLELDLHEVPNFVQIDVDGGQNWWEHLLEFLSKRGLTIYWVTDEVKPEQDEYYTVSGLSPRGNGIYHIVIYQNGKMVHDPHPDNTGLLSETSSYMVRPIG